MIKWWCLMFNLPQLVYVSYHNDPASVKFPFCKLQIPLADPTANLFVISWVNDRPKSLAQFYRPVNINQNQ